MHPIEFKAIYQERVWGGRWLAEKLGRELPAEGPIGESWEIVDRPEAQSVEVDSGKTLREMLAQHPKEIMGPGYDPARPFPILVKWLDCRDRLSLQVHPPESVAAELGGEPKTECWYIADTAPNAALLVGLRRGVTREQFRHAIADEALEPLLHRFEVQPGESMLIESGRLHAIDAGNLILEIQENSDTTYRVYDWGRKGLDGKPRQLHVDESMRSINFEDFEPSATPGMTEPGSHVIAECSKFRIRQINLAAGESIPVESQRQPRILSVVSGEVTDHISSQSFNSGANVLLPYSWEGTLGSPDGATILLTDRFA